MLVWIICRWSNSVIDSCQLEKMPCIQKLTETLTHQNPEIRFSKPETSVQVESDAFLNKNEKRRGLDHLNGCRLRQN